MTVSAIVSGGNNQLLPGADGITDGVWLLNRSAGELRLVHGGVLSDPMNGVPIQAGTYYETPPPCTYVGPWSVWGATTGQVFEWGPCPLPMSYVGPKGDKGDAGPVGATGSQGAGGVAGPAGPAGATGAIGPAGPAGAVGAAGPKGDTGASGSQGTQGLKGDKGDTGATGPAGAAGSVGAAGPAGPQGVAGPTGSTGPAGIVPAYAASGALSGLKMWVDVVATDASGNWTANLTAAGFTATPNVQAQALSADQSAANSAQATVSSRSITAAAGAVVLPITLLALGLTNKKAGAGVSVMVVAIGK